MKTNKAFDEYIDKAADFAKPILVHLRSLVQTACPDIEEEMKWSFPNFQYKGQILCSMAAFKKHCTFGFWLGNEMEDPDGILNQIGKTAMGDLGQIKSLESLPADEVLIKYIKQAMEMIDKGVKKAPNQEKKTTDKTLEIPDDLLDALSENPLAKATFEQFSHTNKKEYIDWLLDAKTSQTRQKRLAEAIAWMNEGKIRNWKYIKK